MHIDQTESLIISLSIMLLILVLCFLLSLAVASEPEKSILYYYGLEESERNLPVCSARQACGVALLRYWRPAALVRLCRCERRARCHNTMFDDNAVAINNRAHFKFCQPILNWPVCKIEEQAITVHGSRTVDPQEIEDIHRLNIQLSPPKIIFKCICPDPFTWTQDLSARSNSTAYKCQLLPTCNSGDYCGDVTDNLDALYQKCLCPRRHICVHNGGVPDTNMTELLYTGAGRRAYCQNYSNSTQDSSEDY